MEFTIKLNEKDIDVIGRTLEKEPYGLVYDLISRLIIQVKEQKETVKE